ncbi:dimethylaniline monooxygenase [N-oxide-forming] 5-like [Lingula anatina]|uniref:Flavin-containing monooxygenase n=1 Tax=Lingula anatina TaxID=7574 RepID=A0A1S3JSL3_LINAN|nr:dimethylaniline monooxygenase [N-oxide-forming] 5-like [Lingula anatina]|eukprot:XP_013413360.1 dimethylaniline monooxygenase [N-oxide-forming] 5-like [Lingula anatina]
MAKKIAIIGAGASGLTAIKCCLDEGLSPTCFERSDDLGGLWNYRPEERADGDATVMKSTIINTSKEMMCYSDFPIPKEYPNFMHNTFIMKYFHLYVEKFDLRKHIKFRHEIVHISQSSDHKVTGRWSVKVKDLVEDQEWTEDFDGVIICTGHHAKKHEPSFPGQEKFRGKIIHTHDYRDHKGYEDKRVVVIGVGNSGNDVATELGRISKQVYLSTRRGMWVLNRVDQYGLPIDIVSIRRILNWFIKIMPFNLMCSIGEQRVNSRFDHARYGIQPEHRIFSQHPTVNDDLPNRILSGGIIIKPNVKQFTETGVEFEDGTFEDNIDVVFLATGYIFGFPFLDEGVIKVKDNVVDLYKYVWPPNSPKSSLAVLGCIQPLGAIFPISELQCRWVTRVFKGLAKLPSKDEMYADIQRKREAMAKRYVKSQRHTIQVDYINYMDELAEQVGCKPDIVKLFCSDPSLAIEVATGPCTPYQYRLMGPGKWDGARNAIRTTMDRVYYPLGTRKVEGQKKTGHGLLKMLIFVIVIVAVLFKFFF